MTLLYQMIPFQQKNQEDVPSRLHQDHHVKMNFWCQAKNVSFDNQPNFIAINVMCSYFESVNHSCLTIDLPTKRWTNPKP